MHPVTEREIRGSFVNCSRGEAQRANLPASFDELPWADLDFLGWVDPKAPQQAYVVVPGDRLLGIKLRRNPSSSGRARMCSLCCTVHPANGVTLMAASRAGRAGREGNTVGVDVCTDLRCSGYVRGWAPAPVVSLLEETTTVEQRVERLLLNLDAFVRRVLR
ncbi:FBP domain-containing protein [Nocardioides sp. MH1]|uniref:FBP domain-containing protein n=1 Tax=Nocardioides sp. MH1 TaxID=3242490 RepID=UPI003521A193